MAFANERIEVDVSWLFSATETSWTWFLQLLTQMVSQNGTIGKSSCHVTRPEGIRIISLCGLGFSHHGPLIWEFSKWRCTVLGSQ